MAKFMAMGSAGGAGATITVTYSSEFYGQTLTATNGTETHTATATSSGSTEFKIKEGGTWTISCTVGGSTYTTTTNVEIAYNTVLEAIPDGSTVTPTDDIQTWLKCAGIRDKTTYTTLADVLADIDTLIALCADSNACNYMARSTTWALAEGSVPAMTDNTHPSGECIGISEYSSSTQKYMAFDGNASTTWTSSSTTVPVWLGYKATQSTIVRRVGVQFGNQSVTNNSTTFKLQGSNTGNSDDWHDIGNSVTDTTSTLQYYDFENSTGYLYHRIFITAQTLTNATYKGCVTILQFYPDADITTNSTAMQIVGKYDYCANALLGNSMWASAICNSTYADSVVEELVPVMTSATTPSGEVTANSEANVSYAGWKAFDGSNSTQWLVATAGLPSGGAYLTYHFANPVNIRAYSLYFDQYAYSETYDIAVSNDGIDYTNIGTDLTGHNVSKSILTWASNYSYVRLHIKAQTYEQAGTNGGRVTTLQFYGRTEKGYTGTVIHSAVEDTTYYMEGGQSVPFCTIASGDTETVLASTIESLKNQTITLYSSVAKDPDNLSNDYSKQIRITPNVTEIYLMPIKSPYWCGSNQGVESCTSANGWSFASATLSGCTFNKNVVALTSTGTTMSAVGGLNPADVTKLVVIAQGVTIDSGTYGSTFYDMASKALSTTNNLIYDSNSLKKYEMNITSGKYFACQSAYGKATNIHAIYFE